MSSPPAAAFRARSTTEVFHLSSLSQSPRQFCQEQLLLLGDEELVPAAQAAVLEILHSTVMKDPDGPTFEARLAVLAAASDADGSTVGAAAQVAQVLLEAWRETHDESPI
jgi:hypothetical protein